MESKRRFSVVLSGAALALGAGTSAYAESGLIADTDPAPSRPSVTRDSHEESAVPESPEEEEARLTKNWGGPRKRLSSAGIDLALVYKGEANRAFSGGRTRGTTTLANLDFRTSLDGGKLLGLGGLTAFVYVLHDDGGRPNDRVGSRQGVSNIEVKHGATRLYEAWVQQMTADEKVSFLVGLHDLNSEFYVTDAAGLFFNPSFGIGADLSQTGANGPSIFPATSPAFRVRAEPTKSFVFQTALFGAKAGDPNEPRGTHVSLHGQDGLLFISELAYLRGREDAKDRRGKFGAGFWTYTRTFDHQTATVTDAAGNTVPVQATSRGAYFLAEQAVTDGAVLFARYGFASTETNPVAHCLSGGLVVTGLIPGREKDRWGLGYTEAALGTEYVDQRSAAGTPTTRTERTYEMNYRIEVLRGLAVQPDIQVVRNPGMGPTIDDAVVGAVRVELNF